MEKIQKRSHALSITTVRCTDANLTRVFIDFYGIKSKVSLVDNAALVRG